MAKPHRILIAAADDAIINRCKEALSGIDCRLATVVNVHDALREIRAFSPHLVLLDTQLEASDPFTLCKQIKQDTVALVVMMTALGHLGDVQSAVDSGADDFVSKPLEEAEVTKRAENMLKLYDAMY